MSIFSLTSQQKKAFETLKWLHSIDDSSRRTGRTYVLALGFLYQILSQSSEEWFAVVDHFDSHSRSHILSDYILRLAKDLGVDRGIERRERGGSGITLMRLRPGYVPPPAILKSFEEFNNLPEKVLSPESESNSVGQKTLWAHLMEEEK